MTTLTSTQRDTLKQMSELIASVKPYQYDFRVLRLKGTDAYYVSNSGLNGAALKALARKGLVEKSTVKFFTDYYRLTDAGIEAVS